MASLVLSLDFELRWGVLDRVGRDVSKYRSNLLSVHDNLPWMLEVFKERNIAATWSTVGAIGCDGWEEFHQVRPKQEPSYRNKSLHYVNQYNEKLDPEGKLYFAPELIRNIVSTPKQELGTHTFGHIYATEESVTYEEMKRDLLTAREFLKSKFDVMPESLVFPRNQVIHEEKLLQEKVIKTYRGNENVPYLSAKNQWKKTFFNRAQILLDTLNPMVSHAYEQNSIIDGNIKSSSMLRIYMSDILRKTHLMKLQHNVKQLRSGEVYHIWLHPHNLGTSQKKRDDFLRFFDFIGEQIVQQRLSSQNMGSLYEKVTS